MSEIEVKLGQKWTHFKHPEREYEIIGIAKNSSDLEEMIIYKALYADEFPFGQLWARPKKEFIGKTIDKKTGKEVERFSFISEK
ncbi:MAG: DUF1653 domain-containing protein [Candidatus Diapherotrites archaeon]|nr:DUF1653 domain-containing protein [Candidatus Diapherotrites archaeon]